MIWLVSQMWMALAGAAILGLLFGWSFRGFLLNGKSRRAVGERDIAKTELEHAKSEIEELYAVQRRAGDGGVVADDATLRRELDLREAKLVSLSEELTKSKNELANLKTAGGAVAGAAALAGGAVTALATGGEAAATAAPATAQPEETLILDDASLEWRNRYLRSRVRKLEGDLDNARTSAPATPVEDADGSVQPVLAGAGAAAVVAAISSDSETADTSVAQDKLKWQNDYLRQRLSFFERQADHAPTAAVVTPVLAAEAIAVADEPEAAPLAEGEESPEQEMARLRWRNRYLESRIAYHEGGEDADGDEGDDGTPGLGGAAVAAGAAAITAGVAALAGEAEAEVTEAVEEVAVDLGEEMTEHIEVAEEIVEETTDPAKGYWDTDREPEAEVEDVPVEADADEAEELLDDSTDEDDALDVEAADEDMDDVSEDDIADEDEEAHDAESDHIEDETYADDEEELELQEDEPEGDDDLDTSDDEEAEVADDDEIETDEDTEPEHAEDAEAESVGIQPTGFDGPVDGEADDLTAIGGIGPKIADVMNDLGIYHYDQIAEWTPENAEWIDEYLNFDGRVDREKWIDQAKILSGD